MNLQIYINDLKYYSLRDLTYGLFLWLNQDVTPRNNPICYDLFKAYVIYVKRFNENNEEYIKSIYEKYSSICKNQSFMNNSDWIKKSNFNCIIKLTSACCSVQYYRDRGYIDAEAEPIIKSLGAHTYKFKYEGIWDNFIRSFEKIPVPNHYPEDIMLTKINKETGKYFTQDDILKKKLKICIPKSNEQILEKPLLQLFFIDKDTYKETKEPYNVFKDILCTYYDVKDNNEYINQLYSYYINNDFKGISTQVLYTYSKLFKSLFKYKQSDRNIISKGYWLNRGYSEEETSNIIAKLQSERSLSLQRAIDTYGEYEGIKKFNEYKEKRNNTLSEKRKLDPMYGAMYSKTINPETGKYYEGDALIEKRREFCKEAFYKGSLKNAQNIREGKTKTVWQKEYWINKGFTEDEAMQKIYEIMPHNGIDYYIQKYGEELGIVKYNQRIEKYKNTMSSKSPEEMMQIIKKRAVKSHKVSKSSIKFFNELIKRLQAESIIFHKIYMNTNEYYIYDHERHTIYFYDFCIPDINVIIEFNGIKYHPYYTINGSELKEWKSLFYNISGEYQRDRDLRKKEIAETNGFSYLVIWDIDEIETSLKKSIQFIKEKLS